MKSSSAVALGIALNLFGANVTQYRLALPGYLYQFPRDHFNHPDFQTEWWYYTGNVHTAKGRRFGFELTFFRQGVTRKPPANVWDVQDVWMAHLALSDVDGGTFLHTERLNRAGAGIAGADLDRGSVWNGNWEASWRLDPRAPGGAVSQTLMAITDEFSFNLGLRPEKPPVIHGQDGISQKAEGAGHASHYISLTRLATKGTITLAGESFAVDGLSWMDHEFFTHLLAPEQTGWDWIGLQLDNGSEIMLYRLRRKDGRIDAYSSGSYIDPQGRVEHLATNEFSFAPTAEAWTSPATGARYPIAWTIAVPSLHLNLALSTSLPQQELTGKTASAGSYWEGAVECSGVSNARRVKGVGYLEMTGYAGAVPLAE